MYPIGTLEEVLDHGKTPAFGVMTPAWKVFKESERDSVYGQVWSKAVLLPEDYNVLSQLPRDMRKEEKNYACPGPYFALDMMWYISCLGDPVHAKDYHISTKSLFPWH